MIDVIQIIFYASSIMIHILRLLLELSQHQKKFKRKFLQTKIKDKTKKRIGQDLTL